MNRRLLALAVPFALIASAALALILLVTGLIMLPGRLGWHVWRRRRKARREAA